jgi:hypothetical protein
MTANDGAERQHRPRLTAPAVVPVHALAVEPTAPVHAGAAVEAGRCLAVIDMCVRAVRAVRTTPAQCARAAVVRVQV